MNATLLLAIYGSILSTILGFIAIYNFLKERRILSVEKHFMYDIDSADYNFLIANISARPFTIVDCMVSNLAMTEAGKLEPDWGMEPSRLKSLFGDEKAAKLVLPHTLHPGEVLIVGTDSEAIIEQFSIHAALSVAVTKNWTPTKKMNLEITHSMSKEIHVTAFELEENELDRLRKKN
jgi:hypothetical protein